MSNGFNNNAKPQISYSRKASNELIIDEIKVILTYSFALIAWVLIARMYANFGIKVIVPAVSAMWVMGTITAYIVKEERENTVKATKWAVLGYLGFLFIYRIAIQFLNGLSSDEIANALNISATTTSGMAISSWLNNILLLASVMTPLGYIIWCAQKFKTYYGKETKSEAFDKIKDIRKGTKRF